MRIETDAFPFFFAHLKCLRSCYQLHKRKTFLSQRVMLVDKMDKNWNFCNCSKESKGTYTSICPKPNITELPIPRTIHSRFTYIFIFMRMCVRITDAIIFELQIVSQNHRKYDN